MALARPYKGLCELTPIQMGVKAHHLMYWFVRKLMRLKSRNSSNTLHCRNAMGDHASAASGMSVLCASSSSGSLNRQIRLVMCIQS
jgi:hypothetical protein